MRFDAQLPKAGRMAEYYALHAVLDTVLMAGALLPPIEVAACGCMLPLHASIAPLQALCTYRFFYFLRVNRQAPIFPVPHATHMPTAARCSCR